MWSVAPRWLRLPTFIYCRVLASCSSAWAAIRAWAFRRRSPQLNKSKRILRLSAPSYVDPRAPQWREQSHTSTRRPLFAVRLTDTLAPQTQGLRSAAGIIIFTASIGAPLYLLSSTIDAAQFRPAYSRPGIGEPNLVSWTWSIIRTTVLVGSLPATIGCRSDILPAAVPTRSVSARVDHPQTSPQSSARVRAMNCVCGFFVELFPRLY